MSTNKQTVFDVEATFPKIRLDRQQQAPRGSAQHVNRLVLGADSVRLLSLILVAFPHFRHGDEKSLHLVYSLLSFSR